MGGMKLEGGEGVEYGMGPRIEDDVLEEQMIENWKIDLRGLMRRIRLGHMSKREVELIIFYVF